MKDTLRAAGTWLVARFVEPSTWGGIAALVAGMSFLPHASDVAAQIPAIGAGIAGVVAIVLKEKAK